jgi:hypothetical protein
MLLLLHDSIGFRLFHLHSVPHLLTHDLRGRRMDYAEAMLSVFDTPERDDWHYMVTGEEL